jgi:hypothetical protein
MLQSSQFDGVAFDPFSFQKMAEFPKDKLFVVYCAGPHCIRDAVIVGRCQVL